ncbi:MAG: sugar phosphate isomerase/epimerase family protein [Armatimonadota bacterium]|nr:sugar phosphate isomerase/epimerase family protein [Armatimonadota bacterium]
MKLGAVTYNVLRGWDLETIITKLEEAGFEAVELRTGTGHGVEPDTTAEERARIRQRFANSGIRLWGLGSACEFHSPDDAERAAQVALAKRFIDLARDVGAVGVKVRPNGLPDGVPTETTVGRIAECLLELGRYAEQHGVEVWLEVHGRGTQEPRIMEQIMASVNHPYVGVCWNSNSTDVVNGSIRENFERLKPWIKSVHINELSNDYPWRELFTLLRESGYDRYTLMEAQQSCEPERFMRYYRALWRELNRP